MQLAKEKGELRIDVKNNGKGIFIEHQSKIFDLGCTFEKEKGTGYGLFHAKEYLESWGDTIRLVESLQKRDSF